ncbi:MULTISPECIES: hypothetical protein [unclassified Microcoleus]
MALYSQLLSGAKKIKTGSYAIAPFSQPGSFTQASLLLSILVDRT